MMSKLCTGVASIILLLAVAVVHGETYECQPLYPSGEGSWTQGSYWSYYDANPPPGQWQPSSQAPQYSDSVYIANGGTVQVNSPVTCESLHIGTTSQEPPSKGSGTLLISAYPPPYSDQTSSVATTACIGEVGTGSVVQTGGC